MSVNPLSKIVIYLITALLIYSGSIRIAFATLSESQNNYTAKFATYQGKHDDYKRAKDAYSSFKTAAAKSDAFTKGRDYLVRCDELLIAYYSYLGEYSQTLNWHEKDNLNKNIQDILREETEFISSHKKRVENVKTLEEIAPLATELDKHQKEAVNKLNFIFASFRVTKATDNSERFNILSDHLISKLQNTDTTVVNNWLSEISEIKKASAQNLEKANGLVEKQNGAVSAGDLKSIEQEATLANTQMKRSINLFKEIIKYI